MRCYLTGHKACTLNVKVKPNQIFIAYNYKYKNVEKIIEEAIISTLNKLNISYKIAKLEIRTKVFFCKICELSQQSKYFLANLTNPIFNVGLEIGRALGLNKEIILIASRRTKLPSDLVRQEVIFYGKDLNRFKDDFINCLNALIKKQD